jgi:HEAT repeat protein
MRNLTFLSGLVLLGGCASAPAPSQTARFGDLATRYIRKAMEFKETPAVRAQAIEAADPLGADFTPLIRAGLKDPHPAVRFAACIELGRQRDGDALAEIRLLVRDADQSVRVGAYFALERLGDGSFREEWTDALRQSAEPSVRRNAALALGQLEDPAVLPLLKRAADEDRDEGVQLQAMEGMAKLGDERAISFFIRDAYGGRGYREPFALLTLGQIKDDTVVPVLRSRLVSSPYLEARLAAARGLGRRGISDGFDLALSSLNWDSPQRELADDLPENQIMRVRTMAAMALGEIGDRRALGPLKDRMQTPDDPRVQLAAARAILMILERR